MNHAQNNNSNNNHNLPHNDISDNILSSDEQLSGINFDFYQNMNKNNKLIFMSRCLQNFK